MKKHILIAMISLSVLATACGGGGSNQQNQTASPTLPAVTPPPAGGPIDGTYKISSYMCGTVSEPNTFIPTFNLNASEIEFGANAATLVLTNATTTEEVHSFSAVYGSGQVTLTGQSAPTVTPSGTAPIMNQFNYGTFSYALSGSTLTLTNAGTDPICEQDAGLMGTSANNSVITATKQ